MTGIDRRTLISAAGLLTVAGAAGCATRRPAGGSSPASPSDPVGALALPETSADPQVAARDAAYWRAVGGLYDVTREVIHLENGNWGMMPRPVLDAHIGALEMVNRRNSYYARREFGADGLTIKRSVADALGCGPNEIALTRGATEALQNLIGGYHWLRPGDAVLFADLDYDSMQTAMAWLAERRGVSVVRIAVPEPATHQALVDAYVQAFDANPKVRLALLTHLSHRTGLVVPVREIAEAARARGVDVIVDAAHSWGQLDFKVSDLGADFVGFNLHKWIGAPIGVGALYIRQDRIPDIDPYMGEPERDAHDIDARVHTGTFNYAAFLAAPVALDVHAAIGPARKEARLRHLRDLWAEEARTLPGVEVLTPNDARLHGGITSFRLAGRTSVEDNRALAAELLERFNIFTVLRTGVAKGACVRVTPALFTTEDDVLAMLSALKTLTT